MKDETVFQEALQLPADQRNDYLDETCAADSAMRQRVLGLLAAHENPRNFLTRPAGVVTAYAEQDFDGSVKPGDTIGPYTIREPLGQGGMGAVFVGVQKQPVRRKVAIKIIKPGMDTQQVIARFGAERQALALMDHPNIAKVIDAGSTPEGRPYFVMELIRGIPITAYCDQARMTTRDRLQLFTSVCTAVEHAHQKGVIHRDLKPSNVLVTEIDGKPVAKVIDFGLAKAFGGQISDQTIYSNFSQAIGTPLYMSPEQASLSGVDVDTRSDVYSLGVMLYELVSGMTPFDRDQFKDVGHDEICRLIREVDPPRPSARFSTLKMSEGSTISKNRRVDERKLKQTVQGELDWIAMKALDKDRNRRYGSPTAIAADVQRYLDDEPVEACPPSTTYYLKKFATRNATLLATMVLVMSALVLGLAVSAWQANAAQEARDLADERFLDEQDARRDAVQQRSRAENNLNLAMVAMDEIYLKSIGKERLLRKEAAGATSTSRYAHQFTESERTLLQRGLAFYDELAEQNREAEGALFVAGRAFYRVALLQKGLKQDGNSRESCVEAILRLERLTEQNPNEPDYFIELGKAYELDAQLNSWWRTDLSSLENAKRVFGQAISLDVNSAEAFRHRGEIHEMQGQILNAITDYGRAIEIAPMENYEYQKRGWLLFKMQRYGEALADIAMAVESKPEDHTNWGDLRDLASCTDKKFRQGMVDLASRTIHLTSLKSKAHSVRGRVLVVLGRGDEAILDLKSALETLPLHGETGRNTCLGQLLRLVNELGEQEGVAQLASDFESIMTEAIETDPQNFDFYCDRAKRHELQGRLEEAASDFSRAISLQPENSKTYRDRGWLYFEMGLFTEALADMTLAVKLNPGDLHNLNWGDRIWGLPECPDENFRKGILNLANQLIEISKQDQRLYFVRGRILMLLGRDEEALEDLRTAISMIPQQGIDAGYLSRFAIALGKQGNHSQVIAEVSKAIAAKPELNGLYEIRAMLFLNSRNWEMARKDLAKFADAPSVGFGAIYRQPYFSALLAMNAGDVSQYRELCGKMLSMFESSGQPIDVHFAAWTCALGPNAVDDYSLALQLSGKALESNEGSRQYLNTMAALQFRAGQYNAAMESFSLVSNREEIITISISYTLYFKAMTEWNLGQKEDARQTLQRAEQRAQVELNQPPEALTWNRELTLELLGREASDLIN